MHLAATNLNQETAGFIQGFNAYREREHREVQPESRSVSRRLRDAPDRRVRAAARAARQLSVRPYVRHSRMDFLQHFLIGKPLEENGQDSVGVLTSWQITAFGNMQLLTGLDLELADGFLQGNASRSGDRRRAPCECDSPGGQTLRLRRAEPGRRAVRADRAALRGALAS